MPRSFSKKRPTYLPLDLIWQVPQTKIYEFFPKKTKYCFVVLSWDEGERIKAQIKRMKDRAYLADIIIADGGSTDGSTCHKFLKDNFVRTLLVTNEKGLCTATRMAIAYALEQRYKGVVTVDGNGKDSVEDVSNFIDLLEQGYDFIQGSRFIKSGYHKNTPLDRYIGIKYILNPMFFLASGFRYTDLTNGFKACGAKYLLDARVQPLRNVFVRFNLQQYLNYRSAKLGYKIKEVPVKRVYPDNGEIPTKINHFQTKMLVLGEAIMTALGHYNP